MENLKAQKEIKNHKIFMTEETQQIKTTQVFHERIPYGKSVHGQEEIDAVVHALKTSTQMGDHVRAMEKGVAKLFEKSFGIMVNSGSAANYLAIELLELPVGSEVITPVLTFATTVAPLVKYGLIPVFIDVEPGTYNIDVTKIEAAITNKTTAMMIPSLIGNLPDWDIIHTLAQKYNLKVIEDSCDTLSATLHGTSTGLRSDISVTSFYGSHIINCAGNGGMLCVNDPKLATKAKLLRSWGRSSSIFEENSEHIENRFNIELEGIPYDAKFVFSHLGYNMEPSEIGAAFGLVQLAKLDKNIAVRINNFNQHYAFFEQFKEWLILPKQQPDSYTGWLAFPITIKSNAPFTRRELQIFFEKRNIQTRTVFTGNILRQPGFKNIACIKDKNGYPYADEVMRGGTLIACHHGLTNHHVSLIHQAFKDFIASL